MVYSFIGGSNPVRSSNADASRLVNLYAEPLVHRTGKTLLAAYGTPGLRLFGTLPGPGGIRCLYRTGDGRLFGVCGNGIYAIYDDGTSDLVGDLRTSAGPVSMADNNIQIVSVDGTYGYRTNLATLVTSDITGVPVPFGDRIGYIDGYFLVNRPRTRVFQFSGLGLPSFAALDFATKEGGNDRLVTLLVHHRQLILFGNRTGEIWYNQGNVNTPFAPIYGSFFQVGAVATHAVCSFAEQVWFLGGNDQGGITLYRLNGYQPEPVSGPAQEHAWAQYPYPNSIEGIGMPIQQEHDAVLYGVRREGHDWLVLHFPTGDATWVFDLATGLWHEWASLGADGRLHRHQTRTHVWCFGKHLVGHTASGALYELRNDTYLDVAEEIRREVVFPPLFQDLVQVRHSKLQVDMESGVGAGTGQGTNPQIALQYSDDGGHSWGSERWRSMGRQGETRYRALWHQLGQARDRRYKLVITDPVKVALLNAYVDVIPGAA